MSLPVSIVIPTANRLDSVVRTVRTALEQDFPSSDYEIIIVIDGVDQPTAEALRNLNAGPRLRLVQLLTNRGPSAARNAGWREAKSELVIFLDDDMICSPGLVREHVIAHPEFKGGRETAGLGAIYVAPNQPPSLAAESFTRGLGSVYLRHREDPAEPWPENVWSFANTSVSRNVLEGVGGFDERLRKREDGELGVRLLQAGVHQQFLPGAVAFQSSTKTVDQLIHDAEVSAECDLLFLETHPERTPHEFINELRKESIWKRRARRLLARNLAITDGLLAPFCSIGEWRGAPRPFRSLAVRALLFRCGLHWYERLYELSGIEILDSSFGPRA